MVKESDWRTAVMKATADAIVTMDESGVIRSFNPAAENLFGYSESEALGQNVRLLIPASSAAAHEPHLDTLLEENQSLPVEQGREITGRAKDGRRMPLSLRLCRAAGPQGHLIAAIMRDLSETKELRNQLAQGRQRLLFLLDMLPYGFFEATPSGHLTLVNRAMERLGGWRDGELMGQDLWSLWDIKNPGGEEVQPEAHSLDTKLLRKNGDRLPVRLHWDYRTSPAGAPLAIAGVVRDISNESLAAQRLRLGEDRFRGLVESSPDWVWEVDAAARFTYLSPRVRDLLGWSPEELLGRTPFDLMPPEEAERMEMIFHRLAPKRAPVVTLECVTLHKNGRPMTMEISGRPIMDTQGQLLGYRGINRDISERVEARQRLIRAKEAAEAADRAKSEFLAVISHELRTPLNSIIGFSDILGDQTIGPLGPKQLKRVESINRSGRQLLELINQILDLSSVSMGKTGLNLSRVRLGSLLESGLTMMRETIANQGLSLSLELPPEEAGLIVRVDEARVKQVLFNLLSNAVKFTQAGGGIVVSASRSGSQISVSVSDTGLGLDPTDAQRIFSAFEQTDSSYSRRSEGLGLGLTLAKSLVEAHGGKIWAESPGKGRGSTFRFTLPAAARAAPAREN